MEKAFRQGNADPFVSGGDDARFSLAQNFGGCGSFAKVVEQDGEHVGGAVCEGLLLPVRQICQRVAAVAGVVENIAFGMPFGVLGNANDCLEFGEVLNPAALEQEAQAGGGAAAFGGPFEPFFADSLFG